MQRTHHFNSLVVRQRKPGRLIMCAAHRFTNQILKFPSTSPPHAPIIQFHHTILHNSKILILYSLSVTNEDLFDIQRQQQYTHYTLYKPTTFEIMTIFKRSTVIAVMLNMNALSSRSLVCAFSMPMFTEQRAMQRTTPSKTDGVEIEIPDFDELFGRIREVSPLAAMAIDGQDGGFDIADQKCKYDFEALTTDQFGIYKH